MVCHHQRQCGGPSRWRWGDDRPRGVPKQPNYCRAAPGRQLWNHPHHGQTVSQGSHAYQMRRLSVCLCDPDRLLQNSSPGLDTNQQFHSICFLFLLQIIIDLPGGRINDPLLWDNNVPFFALWQFPSLGIELLMGAF